MCDPSDVFMDAVAQPQQYCAASLNHDDPVPAKLKTLNDSRCLRCAAIVLLIGIAPTVAMAYIDPGNGAYMVQVLFTLAGGGNFLPAAPDSVPESCLALAEGAAQGCRDDERRASRGGCRYRRGGRRVRVVRRGEGFDLGRRVAGRRGSG
jgi:hypothetical protein